MTEARSNSLYQKILAVQKKVDAVPKRGYNSFHKYSYATEADILTVKETLNANGLVVLPTTLEEETGFKPDGKSWARVTLLFKVVDVDTGEAIESQFTGYAEDNNDKAIYKATTGANKYFYLKFFGIATEDDPEREEAPKPQQGGQQQSQPKKPQAGSTITPNTPASGTPTAKRGYNGDARYKKDSGIDVTKLAAGEHSTVAGYKNEIFALKEQYSLDWGQITEITGLPSVVKCQDIGDLKAARDNLVSYLEHFVKGAS